MASVNSDLAVLAERYTNALYDLCEELKVTDRVAKELRGIQQALVDSTDLSRLFKSPVLPREAQMQGLRALLTRLKTHKVTKNYVLLLARNRRLSYASQLIDAFLVGIAVRRGQISAQVTSAQALTAAEAKDLKSALDKALQSDVQVDMQIDPAILGGLIVKVGSQMIDSSLRSKLSRLRTSMKEIS